jgi:hypothetical protein
MSYIPTGAADIVKQPQFTEETVDGTLPVTVTGGTHFVSCGFVESLGEDIAENNNQVRPLGSYDVQKKIQLNEEISGEIVFQPSDFKLMKRGILTPISPSTTPADPTMVAPNGTNGVSISILFTALINGTEKWKVYKGVRFDGCSGTIERESGFKVTMPFHAKDVTDWTVTPTFTPAATYAAAPSLTPWSGITSGADPLDINGVKYDTTSFKFDVNWTIARPSFNGLTTYKLSKPIKREIKVSFNTVTIGGSLVGDLRAFTPRDVTYTIVGPSTNKIAFNQVAYDTYSKPIAGDSDDVWMEEYEGQATNGITFTGT